MIEPGVLTLAKDFTDRWNNFLSISPLLVLDNNWPSVGVIDLLTFGLRLRKDLPEHDKKLIRGSAAYLACMIASCWEQMSLKVNVVRGPKGITIQGTGGDDFEADEKLELEVEHDLGLLLRDYPYPLPIFWNADLPVHFDTNVMAHYVLGWATGLGQSVVGPWEQKERKKHQREIERVVKELARQSAAHYGRIYPDEPLGQVAELYLSALVYPPMFIDEEIPGINAVNSLLDFFESYQISPPKMLSLCYNLALSANEVFSSAGLTLYMALIDQIPPPEIIAVAQSKSNFIGLLRYPMVRARQRLSLGEDWAETGVKGPKDEQRYLIEYSMGLIPWLVLSVQRVKKGGGDPDLLKMLQAMMSFDFPAAEAVCAEMVEKSPGDVEMRVQRARFEMLKGQYKEASMMLSTLTTEPEADSNPRFYNLWGLCALEIKQFDQAVKYFRAALAIADNDPHFKADIANNLGWTYILIGDGRQAVEYLDLCLETTSCPVTALLNKAHVYSRTNQFELILPIRKKLFKLAPTDRRVFATVSAAPALGASGAGF